MRLIDADAKVHISIYNGQYEEYTDEEMSIADILDSYSDEGCPDEVERKKGKWNFIGNNMHECTNCKRAYTVQQFEAMRNYNRDPLNPKFCPNCGADMREEKTDG